MFVIEGGVWRGFWNNLELSNRGIIKGSQCACVAGTGLILPVFCAGLCYNRIGGSGTLAGPCVASDPLLEQSC